MANFSRREFLKTLGLSSAGLACSTAAIPTILRKNAYADGSTPQKYLLTVFLDGGADFHQEIFAAGRDFQVIRPDLYPSLANCAAFDNINGKELFFGPNVKNFFLQAYKRNELLIFNGAGVENNEDKSHLQPMVS